MRNSKEVKEFIKNKKEDFEGKVKGSMTFHNAITATGIKEWEHPSYPAGSPHAFVDLFYRFLIEDL